ncbi:GNAT family N-acetyltransferase [Nocardioides sp. GXQ0305]|uniref:GNAT family N-acetyltransferase n=1 Tax=Nocardioides sp. GXQ0305 TaxID=3423912 RepID=UPI003D7DE9FE
MTAVHVEAVDDPRRLREVSDLFARVWGRNDEGVPISSEMMRSLAHAGGLVSAAYDGEALVGAAVLGRDEPGACYGYLAAVAPGLGDRGLGRALKQHQREWALGHGVTTMRWTFDPLVARNARVNLTRLGATAGHYEVAFYGEMADEQNAGEVGDRLVATWRMDSARVAAALAGEAPEPPPPRGAVADGPDGAPAVWSGAADRWIRVPADVLAVRRQGTGLATAWREAARAWFEEAFADGWVAEGVSRDSVYHLSRRDP